MKINNKTTLSGVVALLLLSCSVEAKTGLDAEVSIGAKSYDTDNESAKLGTYNGIGKDTNRLFGDLDLDYNSDSYHLYLSANDLGLSPSYLGLGGGTYGLFGFSFEHSYLDHLIGVNAKTPFDGVGSETLTLPAGFVDGANVAAMTTLASDLKTIELETKRNSSRADLSYTPSDRWKLSLAAYREAREGTVPLGLAARPAGPGGYPGVILPSPVDEATNNLVATVGYDTPVYQLELSYHLSSFDNKHDSLTWDSPFGDANSSNAADKKRNALDPDNDFHSLSLNGAYNITETTRLAMSANFSTMEQDEQLLAYTINGASVITTPLPRSSADTKVENTRMHLKLTGKPLPNLKTSLSYNYDKRDNKTPVALWQRVVTDVGNQVAANSSQATNNHHNNFTKNSIKLAGSYYFGEGTGLDLGYGYKTEKRSDRPVNETNEHSIDAKFKTRLSTVATGSISLKHDRRRGDDDYNHSIEFNALHSDAYIALGTDTIDNNPDLRQMDIADRDRNSMDLKINFYPVNDIAVALYGSLVREDYPDSILGMSSTDRKSATIDLSYSPNRKFTLFGFYTKDQNEFELWGRSFTSAANVGDTVNNWTMNNRDDIDTVTLGTIFSLLEDDLKISLKGNYIREKNKIDFSSGNTMPEDKTVIKNIEAEGAYALNKSTKVKLGVSYEKYDSENWSEDGIEPATSAGVGSDKLLTLLSPDTDYSAYAFYAMLNYKW